ncbi:MAG: thioredoxin family protein [Candidatus Micrarchaeota archaeon]|nr:thioredoxin family protein [Candidatus Micrarchaeota archaeon]
MVLLTSNDTVLKLGENAPSFILYGIDGKNHSLLEFKGKKALLIIFMCNHCPYVKPKMQKMVDLQSRYGDLGFQLVAINPNDPSKNSEDSEDGMKQVAKDFHRGTKTMKNFAINQMAKEKGFNFPYLVDETQQIAKKYGAVCTPDPYLFNEKRELVYHGRIDDAHGKSEDAATTNELEEAIKQVLLSGKTTVKQFPSMGCSIKWKS